MRQIVFVTFLVRDYDEAIEFFTEKMNFELVEDTKLSDEKRWIVVSPKGISGCSLLLAKASSEEQIMHIGNQTGGRVSFFLNTEDFYRDYEYMKSKGIKFLEDPRNEEYGVVSKFEDLYKNKWDLLQLKKL